MLHAVEKLASVDVAVSVSEGSPSVPAQNSKERREVHESSRTALPGAHAIVLILPRVLGTVREPKSTGAVATAVFVRPCVHCPVCILKSTLAILLSWIN